MRWVDLLRSNVMGAKSRAQEQIERIRHALIIEYISSLGLSFLCTLFGGMPKAGARIPHRLAWQREVVVGICVLGRSTSKKGLRGHWERKQQPPDSSGRASFKTSKPVKVRATMVGSLVDALL
jgi:hypothetical protein